MLLHLGQTNVIHQLANGDPVEEAKLTAAACAKMQCYAQFEVGTDAYNQYKQLADWGSSPALVAERQQIDAQGDTFNYGFIGKASDALTLLNNTYQLANRAVGTVEFAGGVAQMFAAGVMSVGGVATCAETGVGCLLLPGAGVVGTAGYDTSRTGVNTVITGNVTSTWGENALQSLGLSPTYASLTYAAIGLSPAAIDAVAVNLAANSASSYNTLARASYADSATVANETAGNTAALGSRGVNVVGANTSADYTNTGVVLGMTDGGPGTWGLSPKFPSGANGAFQQSVTGAPAGVEYGVSTNLTSSNWKWFDGYSPTTGNLIDAKNYTNWPTQSFPMSTQIVTDDLAMSDAIAGSLGRTSQIVVPSQETANILNNIVRTNSLQNTIISVHPTKP
jgi:hypothetical protein